MNKTKKEKINDSIKTHIRNYINIKDLKSQIEAVKYPNMNTDIQAIDYIIQGGGFLIYYYDVKKYLKRIGAISKTIEISDNKSWNLYKNLIITNALELIK